MRIQWIGYLLSAFYIQNAYSWIFKSYPYADLSIEEKIVSDGYPLEIHEVTTEDNYIITIFRIPHGKQSEILKDRSPVLILHGMGGSSELFIAQGKDRALPYNLADAGFDVWLMNSRGSYRSQGHKYYNLDFNKTYWNYGFHEIAVYDIPASIDYIIGKTHQKLFVIGHSQGNTCYFITTSERVEYNDKIKLAVAYAPSIYISYMDIPISILFSYMVDIFEAIWSMLDLHEILPFVNILGGLAKRLCREQTYFLQFCFHFLSLIGTYESKLIDKDLLPVISGAPLPRLSSKQFFHYMQLAKSGIFRQYDYGTKKNLRVYGMKTPPEYDLKKSTAPLAVFYAERDAFTTKKAAERVIYSTFPNVIFHHKVGYEYFTHIDFLFGWNASILVYQKTIKLFKDHDNEILSQNETKINQSIT